MRIAHFVGHSLVRYTPGRIATYWGRYTPHEGRAFALRRERGWGFFEPLNPYGFYCPHRESKRALFDWVNSCDALHFHDDTYPDRLAATKGIDIAGKPTVYHAHIGNIA